MYVVAGEKDADTLAGLELAAEAGREARRPVGGRAPWRIFVRTSRNARIDGLDNFEKIAFWRTPVANCGGGRTCVPYYRWVSDYIAILGGR